MHSLFILFSILAALVKLISCGNPVNHRTYGNIDPPLACPYNVCYLQIMKSGDYMFVYDEDNPTHACGLWVHRTEKVGKDDVTRLPGDIFHDKINIRKGCRIGRIVFARRGNDWGCDTAVLVTPRKLENIRGSCNRFGCVTTYGWVNNDCIL